MIRSQKTAALGTFLLENCLLLKRATLAEISAAFESETGFTTSNQGAANVADSVGLERRRRRGPVTTKTEQEKRYSKRARQRHWLRKKRAILRQSG